MLRERKTTTSGEDSRVDDDPRIEVCESSSGEDSDDVDDDDPKIEVYENDGDEEGGVGGNGIEDAAAADYGGFGRRV